MWPAGLGPNRKIEGQNENFCLILPEIETSARFRGSTGRPEDSPKTEDAAPVEACFHAVATADTGSAYDHRMDLPPAEYLAHYTKRETAFGDILPQGQLRMSPYTQVNDPLENKPWQIPPAAFHHSSKPMWKWWTFGEGIREIWQSAKLLALTQDAPVEEGYMGATSRYGACWARARMWDRYAENHEGVCLVFDADRLRANIIGSLAAQDLAHPYFGPVAYTPEGPFPRLQRLIVPASPDGPSGPGHAEFVEQHHRDFFFLKALDWKSEYEFRFVVTAPGGEYLHVDYGDALVAVVVGESFPGSTVLSARRACERASATPLTLKWASGGPTLLRLCTPEEREAELRMTGAAIARGTPPMSDGS